MWTTARAPVVRLAASRLRVSVQTGLARRRRTPQQWRVDAMNAVGVRGAPWNGYELPRQPKENWDAQRLSIDDLTARLTMRVLSLETGRRAGALGTKLGSLTHVDAWGRTCDATAIHVPDCYVIRAFENGPRTVILEAGASLKPNSQSGSAERPASIRARLRYLRGFSIGPGALLPPGTRVRATHFVPGQYVDVQAEQTMGKGFQGAMVRWGFKGMPASHGCSVTHRSIGSTGARSTPGRVFKGKRMAGRMGGERATRGAARVLRLDTANDVLVVEGSIPGPPGARVRIIDALFRNLKRSIAVPYPTDAHSAATVGLRIPLPPPNPAATLLPPVFVDEPAPPKDTLAIRTSGEPR